MQDPQIVQAIEGIKQLVKREFPLNKKRAGEDPSLPPEFRSYDFVNVYELGQTIVEVEIAMKALIDLIKPARADNAEQ